MSDEWPEPPRDPGPFAGGPPVGPPPGTGSDPDGEGRPAPSPWDRPSGEYGATPPSSATPGAMPWPGAAGSGTPAPPPAPGGLPFSPTGSNPPPAGPGSWPGATGPGLPGPPPGSYGPVGGPPPNAWGGPGWQAGPPVGPGPVGQPLAPGPGRPRVDRAPAWLLGLAAVLVVLLVAGTVYVVTSDSGPDYPDEWDSRVTDLVSFAERERGLRFDHPVEVNFLTAEEYSDASRSDSSVEGTTDEEEAEMADFVATLRAIGLVEGEFDLQEATDQISDAGTLAFYDPTVKQVYVRGTELTPSLRATLVHELTHVLQDQHFDLERIGELDGATAATLRAMAEGDADRVESVYIDDMSEADHQKYQEQLSSDLEGSEEDLADVPPVLTALFGAPYYFGPALVEIAFTSDGNDAVDRLFETPPSEFALFDPVGNPPDEHPAEDQDVLEPALPDGAEEIEQESFSPVMWYLMLASRIEEADAFDAVAGIEADGYRSYRQDGDVCVTGQARTVSDDDANELRSALEAWAEAGPDGTATVDGTGDQVEFTSCDPGADAASGGEVSEDVLLLPARRNYTYAELLGGAKSQGLDGEQSRCYADGIVELIPVEDLVNPGFEPSAEQRSEVDRIATGCR